MIYYVIYMVMYSTQDVHGLYRTIMIATIKPYFDMMLEWVSFGRVRDPYGEFFVLEHAEYTKDDLKSDMNDAYWESKFTVASEGARSIPECLAAISDKIFLTGKVLSM